MYLESIFIISTIFLSPGTSSHQIVPNQLSVYNKTADNSIIHCLVADLGDLTVYCCDLPVVGIVCTRIGRRKPAKLRSNDTECILRNNRQYCCSTKGQNPICHKLPSSRICTLEEKSLCCHFPHRHVCITRQPQESHRRQDPPESRLVSDRQFLCPAPELGSDFCSVTSHYEQKSIHKEYEKYSPRHEPNQNQIELKCPRGKTIMESRKDAPRSLRRVERATVTIPRYKNTSNTYYCVHAEKSDFQPYHDEIDTKRFVVPKFTENVCKHKDHGVTYGNCLLQKTKPEFYKSQLYSRRLPFKRKKLSFKITKEVAHCKNSDQTRGRLHDHGQITPSKAQPGCSLENLDQTRGRLHDHRQITPSKAQPGRSLENLDQTRGRLYDHGQLTPSKAQPGRSLENLDQTRGRLYDHRQITPTKAQPGCSLENLDQTRGRLHDHGQLTPSKAQQGCSLETKALERKACCVPGYISRKKKYENVTHILQPKIGNSQNIPYHHKTPSTSAHSKLRYDHVMYDAKPPFSRHKQQTYKRVLHNTSQIKPSDINISPQQLQIGSQKYPGELKHQLTLPPPIGRHEISHHKLIRELQNIIDSLEISINQMSALKVRNKNIELPKNILRKENRNEGWSENRGRRSQYILRPTAKMAAHNHSKIHPTLQRHKILLHRSGIQPILTTGSRPHNQSGPAIRRHIGEKYYVTPPQLKIGPSSARMNRYAPILHDYARPSKVTSPSLFKSGPSCGPPLNHNHSKETHNVTPSHFKNGQEYLISSAMISNYEPKIGNKPTTPKVLGPSVLKSQSSDGFIQFHYNQPPSLIQSDIANRASREHSQHSVGKKSQMPTLKVRDKNIALSKHSMYEEHKKVNYPVQSENYERKNQEYLKTSDHMATHTHSEIPPNLPREEILLHHSKLLPPLNEGSHPHKRSGPPIRRHSKANYDNGYFTRPHLQIGQGNLNYNPWINKKAPKDSSYATTPKILGPSVFKSQHSYGPTKTHYHSKEIHNVTPPHLKIGQEYLPSSASINDYAPILDNYILSPKGKDLSVFKSQLPYKPPKIHFHSGEKHSVTYPPLKIEYEYLPSSASINDNAPNVLSHEVVGPSVFKSQPSYGSKPFHYHHPPPFIHSDTAHHGSRGHSQYSADETSDYSLKYDSLKTYPNSREYLSKSAENYRPISGEKYDRSKSSPSSVKQDININIHLGSSEMDFKKKPFSSKEISYVPSSIGLDSMDSISRSNSGSHKLSKWPSLITPAKKLAKPLLFKSPLLKAAKLGGGLLGSKLMQPFKSKLFTGHNPLLEKSGKTPKIPMLSNRHGFHNALAPRFAAKNLGIPINSKMLHTSCPSFGLGSHKFGLGCELCGHKLGVESGSWLGKRNKLKLFGGLSTGNSFGLGGHKLGVKSGLGGHKLGVKKGLGGQKLGVGSSSLYRSGSWLDPRKKSKSFGGLSKESSLSQMSPLSSSLYKQKSLFY